MGLIDGLYNVPERFKRCCSSLAPLPTNNNNQAITRTIDFLLVDEKYAPTAEK